MPHTNRRPAVFDALRAAAVFQHQAVIDADQAQEALTYAQELEMKVAKLTVELETLRRRCPGPACPIDICEDVTFHR